MVLIILVVSLVVLILTMNKVTLLIEYFLIEVKVQLIIGKMDIQFIHEADVFWQKFRGICVMRINLRDKYYHFNCEKRPISKLLDVMKLMLGKDSHSRFGDAYFLGRVLLGNQLGF